MLNNYYLSMILFFSMFLMFFIGYITWKRRKMPIALKLSMIMLATSLYTFGYAHEVMLSDTEGIKVCLMIEYLGIPFIPALWLTLVFDYTGLHFARKYVYGLLFIIPVITLILHYTNDWHHLFYKSIDLVYNADFPKVYLKKGPWYWVHIGYSYLAMAACVVLLFIKYLKEGSLYRKQIVVLSLGFCIPWGLNIIYTLNNRRPFLDLTPFGFIFSAVLLTWAIYRLNLLRFTPIAFEKIVRYMPDGVIILDYRDRIIHFNDSAGSIIPELKVINTEQENYETVFKNYPVIVETLRQNLTAETQFRIHKNDISGIYKLKLTFISNKKYIIGKILVLTDITACEKYMENLTAASAQLTALNTLKDRLISIVASDIREPLDMLINLSELLKSQEGDSGNNRKLIGEIQKQVNSIFLRVDNMLEYFQNKQTSIIYSPMEWKLSFLAGEAVKTIIGKAETKKITVSLDIADRLYVYADKGMIHIVLRNLLSNAVKFTNRNGSITITARQEGDFVILSVKDTGIGIDPQKVQVLFQDVEGSPCPGTEGEMGIGLGLLLCSQIIKRNYGDIWVDSTIGEGSNFFVSIPAAGKRDR